jgi:hypothetical protein
MPLIKAIVMFSLHSERTEHNQVTEQPRHVESLKQIK